MVMVMVMEQKWIQYWNIVEQACDQMAYNR